MPSLNWDSKTPPKPIPGDFKLESQVFPHGDGYPDADTRDRLILGDNLAVMSALLPEYEGRVDLIYADPPFFTNRRYRARVGRGEDSRRPEEWQLAEGYPDHWEDLDAYLDMLYPRLHLMHRLLSPSGMFYLHLDWHADHYARLLLDEIFGPNRLLNEIIWVYHGPSPIRSAFNRKHDTILAYTKSDRYTFNVDAVREPYNPNTVRTFKSSRKAGFGKTPNLKRGKVPEDWWYFPVVARLHNERTGYPTQKPEALLERIILASSHPGDLVADFFCGSGTTATIAARHGRRFIANDGVWRAVYTTRSRLAAEGAAPFALLREARAAWPLKPIGEEAKDAPLELTEEGILRLIPDELPELEYWEADPHWDGAVFRSAAQAVRPLRKGDLPGELTLPERARGEPVCVRLVDVKGRQYQVVFDHR